MTDRGIKYSFFFFLGDKRLSAAQVIHLYFIGVKRQRQDLHPKSTTLKNTGLLTSLVILHVAHLTGF